LAIFWASYALAGAPAVTTHPASYVQETYAKLNGFFDPNGNFSTVRWFEWGASPASLNQSTFHNPYGGGASSISAGINNLKKNTNYYFRAAAQNADGLSYGLIYNFKTGPNPSSGSQPVTTTTQVPTIGNLVPITPPSNLLPTASLIATTRLATFITQNGARLNGTAISNSNIQADAWFEWGPSVSLENKSDVRALNSNASINLAETLTGLSPNASIFFRVVVKNIDIVAYGDIFSFRTLAVPLAPVPTTPAPTKPTPTPTPSPPAEPEEEAKEDSETDSENLAAVSAAGGNLLPDSLGGWIVLIVLLLLAFLLGWHMRRIYEKKVRERETEEKIYQETTGSSDEEVK